MERTQQERTQQEWTQTEWTQTEWTLHRLEQLRADLARGTSQLIDLNRRQAELRDTVLRVEGAIRVLEEQIAADPAFAELAAQAP